VSTIDEPASEPIPEEAELVVQGACPSPVSFLPLHLSTSNLTLLSSFVPFASIADDSEREPESSIIDEATIVVTSNEDVEIPSETAPPSTDQADFDASAAEGLYDDDEEELEDKAATIEDVPAVEEVVDQEDVETIAQVEKEAADATTSLDAVETVPVPPQFVVEDGDSAATTSKDVAPASEDHSAAASSEFSCDCSPRFSSRAY